MAKAKTKDTDTAEVPKDVDELNKSGKRRISTTGEADTLEPRDPAAGGGPDARSADIEAIKAERDAEREARQRVRDERLERNA
jgi:hypothetical protein